MDKSLILALFACVYFAALIVALYYNLRQKDELKGLKLKLSILERECVTWKNVYEMAMSNKDQSSLFVEYEGITVPVILPVGATIETSNRFGGKILKYLLKNLGGSRIGLSNCLGVDYVSQN